MSCRASVVAGSLVIVSLLALLTTSSATCTVGTMKNADYATLPCAIRRCKPNADGKVTLFIKGEFPMTEFNFEEEMMPKNATEYYLLPYDWTNKPRFVGSMIPFAPPKQLAVLGLSGLTFDYQGGNCEMTAGPLEHTQLMVEACVFMNGTCDFVWRINNIDAEVNTIMYNRVSDIPAFARINVYGSKSIISGNTIVSSEKVVDDFVEDALGEVHRAANVVSKMFDEVAKKAKL